MANTRSKNAVLNIFYGYISQVGILVLSFISRKIFLSFLSVDYLGINGLYTNILTVLSLAELGLDAAVLYSLYKPVADNNTALIRSMLAYFRKIYAGLAVGIYIVGLMLIPFLEVIINSDLNSTELVIYYVLFLTNTVCTYFVAHKVALLAAYQEQHITKVVMLSSNLLMQILHIIVLVVWRNYYVYVLATVISTLANNLLLSFVSSRRHKELKEKYTPVDFDKTIIKGKIFSTLVYKLGAVLINNTTSIFISILVNTAAVGYYSNYFTIVSGIQGFVAIISTALISGVGNLNATGNKEKQYGLFHTSVLFYHFISALGLIGFTIIFNDVIGVWIGAEYAFDQTIVFAIALNFYVTNAVSPIWMWREANGLFESVKYLMLIRAGINILLSIILGKLFGTFGILLSLSLSLMLTSFWYEPRILFDKVFSRSPVQYWLKQSKYFAVTIASLLICFFISRGIGFGFGGIVLKTLLVVGITTLAFAVTSLRSAEIKEICKFLQKRK